VAKAMNTKKRFGHCVSLMVLDIDHFKNINDTYGHPVGDEVLSALSSTINKNIRNTDSVARWGGEEFIVLASDTNIVNALILAEKLRTSIEGHHFSKVKKVTVSIGVSEYNGIEDFSSWFNRADGALYWAKAKGRNQVLFDGSYSTNTESQINVISDLFKTKWSKEMNSGSREIDSQHKELLHYANLLVEYFLNKQDKNDVTVLLHDFVDKSKEHFNYEESLLSRIHFKDVMTHKDEHLKLQTKLEEIVNNYLKGNVNLFIFL
jgi:diguanylate cyclase (GGDEF)-like protein/hemerythrin-like metal-binding protein